MKIFGIFLGGGGVEGKTQKLWDGGSGKSFHISDLSRCFSDELKIMEEYGVFLS
jgi:hypothetical protein